MYQVHVPEEHESSSVHADEHLAAVPNGWFPRRTTPDGRVYRKSPDGGDDRFWQTSADGLFILDSDARIVLSYPFAQVSERDLIGIPDVKKAYEEAKPFFTKVHVLAETGRRAMFAFAPLKSAEGRTVGVIGGEIDPTTHFLRNTVRSLPEESNTVIELIDEDGIVIASSHPERVFSCSDRSRFMGDLIASKEKDVFQCHRCHISDQTGTVDDAAMTTDILAFAPLQEAPWGVAVREPEEDIFYDLGPIIQRFDAFKTKGKVGYFVDSRFPCQGTTSTGSDTSRPLIRRPVIIEQ